MAMIMLVILPFNRVQNSIFRSRNNFVQEVQLPALLLELICTSKIRLSIHLLRFLKANIYSTKALALKWNLILNLVIV